MALPPRPEPLRLAGPAGTLEVLLEDPGVAAPSALMVVCHPHPLHGGTMHNKVVTTLARCANELGAPTVRFNYRGVGESQGSFDEGRGETDDAMSVVSWARERWPGAALWLAGFSFGGLVALRASNRVGATDASRLVTVAPAITRQFGAPEEVRSPACPWLVVQGDKDEVLDPVEQVAWCRRITPPPQLSLIADTGHYFHGRLNELRAAVLPFLEQGRK
jgi:alpha/beta superfamily hydrolase